MPQKINFALDIVSATYALNGQVEHQVRLKGSKKKNKTRQDIEPFQD